MKVDLNKYVLFCTHMVADGYSDQIRELKYLIQNWRKNYNAINDPFNIKYYNFDTVEAGGTLAKFRQATVALAKKLMWINSKGKELSGSTEVGFIPFFVKKDENGNYVMQDMINLCLSFVDTLDAVYA